MLERGTKLFRKAASPLGTCGIIPPLSSQMDFKDLSLSKGEITEATAYAHDLNCHGLTVDEIALLLRYYRDTWKELYGELPWSSSLSPTDVLDLASIEGQSISCAFRIEERYELGIDPLLISKIIDAHMTWDNVLARKPFRVDDRQRGRMIIDYS